MSVLDECTHSHHALWHSPAFVSTISFATASVIRLQLSRFLWHDLHSLWTVNARDKTISETDAASGLD